MVNILSQRWWHIRNLLTSNIQLWASGRPTYDYGLSKSTSRFWQGKLILRNRAAISLMFCFSWVSRASWHLLSQSALPNCLYYFYIIVSLEHIGLQQLEWSLGLSLYYGVLQFLPLRYSIVIQSAFSGTNPYLEVVVSMERYRPGVWLRPVSLLI